MANLWGVVDLPDRQPGDQALQELQVTLNIARRNSLEDENDTWVLFSDQHLEVVHPDLVQGQRCSG